MMFADDVLLCAIVKVVQCWEALEKRGMKLSNAKTGYMCLNGTPLGSVKMQSAQLSHVTVFKYLGSSMQSDAAMNGELNEWAQCVWNNWMNMSGVHNSYATKGYNHILRESTS